MAAEMEQQQKIMKVMFPLMMPIFMYAAPSGLTIYFITNSTLGILENKHIRSSAEKKGLLDPEKIKAEKAEKRARKGGTPGKPGGGFMAKLQALAEQQQAAQQQKAKKVQNTARKPEVRDRNYKSGSDVGRASDHSGIIRSQHIDQSRGASYAGSCTIVVIEL